MRRLAKPTATALAIVLLLSLMSGCAQDPEPGPDSGPQSSYTVTFDIGDEAEAAGVSVPAAQTVMRGSKAVEPTIDFWEGHELTGWFNGNDQWDFSEDTVTANITLDAQWREVAAGDVAAEYEESLTWGEPGHLYVHYLHGADDINEHGMVNDAPAPTYNEPIDSDVYGDWGLWVWEYLPTNSEGRAFYPMKLDESGAVYDIDLSETYNDAGWDSVDREDKGLTITYGAATWLGIQVFSHYSRLYEQGFWVNDGGDVYIELNQARREKGDYHWFIRQGEAQNGTPTYESSVVFNPYDGIEYGSAVTQYDVVSNKGNNDVYTQQPLATGWEDDSIGYQIFVASFADSDDDGMGDLQGVIENLDYLDDTLNVDVLWLTPFQQSNSYHGYDIKDYFTVDPRFGTIEDFRELVYEAHKRGMKILMDFVFEHTSPSNPWFIKSQKLVKETVQMPDGSLKVIDYRNFYNWRNEDTVPKTGRAAKQWFKDPNGYYYFSSFNSGMPELNFDYQAVRDAILNVALYWMSFGLDGFRLDAVKHVYMENENDQHSNHIVKDTDVANDADYSYDLKKNEHFFLEFNAKLKASYPNALLLGENLTGDPAKLAALYGGFDSQFNFNFYFDTTGCLSYGSQQYDAGEDWRSNNYIRKVMSKYVCAQMNFEQKRGDQYIDSLFTSNHDVQRARDRLVSVFDSSINDWYSPGVANLGDAAAVAAGVERSGKLSKLYAAMLMTLPGITWIYNGDELGMFGTKTENADGSPGHEDRWYRQPMKWSKTVEGSEYNCEYPIGFNNYVMTWDSLNMELDGVAEQLLDENSLLNVYSDFAEIRKSSKAFSRGIVTDLYSQEYDSQSVTPIIGYMLQNPDDPNDVYYVFINPTGTATRPNDADQMDEFYESGLQVIYSAGEGWRPGQDMPAYSVAVLKRG